MNMRCACSGGVVNSLSRASSTGGGQNQSRPICLSIMLLSWCKLRLSQCPLGLNGPGGLRSGITQIGTPSRLRARTVAEVPLRNIPRTNVPTSFLCKAGDACSVVSPMDTRFGFPSPRPVVTAEHLYDLTKRKVARWFVHRIRQGFVLRLPPPCSASPGEEVSQRRRKPGRLNWCGSSSGTARRFRTSPGASGPPRTRPQPRSGRRGTAASAGDQPRPARAPALLASGLAAGIATESPPGWGAHAFRRVP